MADKLAENIKKAQERGLVRPSTAAKYQPVAPPDELMNAITSAPTPTPSPAPAPAGIQVAQTPEDFAQLEAGVRNSQMAQADAAAMQQAQQTQLAAQQQAAADQQAMQEAKMMLAPPAAPPVSPQQHQQMMREQQKQMEYEQSLVDTMDGLQSELDSHSQMVREEPDYNRWWNNRTTGQKIMSALSVGLGAYSGGENVGLKLINQAIEHDVQQQRDEIERRTAANKLSLDKAKFAHEVRKDEAQLGLASAKFQSEQSAKMAAANKPIPPSLRDGMMRLKGYEATIAKLELMEARNPKAAQGMLQQLNAQKQQLQAQLADTIATGKASVSPDMIDGSTPFAFVPPKLHDQFVPGVGLASSKEGAAQVREAVAAKNQIKDVIGQLRKLKAMSLTDRSKAGVDVQEIVGALRLPLFGPGVMTDSEREQALKLVGDPTKVFSFSDVEMTKLDQLEAMMDRSVNAKASANIPGYKSASKVNILRKQ